MEQGPLFREQIRLERERRGWSQSDLAEKVECDPKTIGRWENGERLPRTYHQQRLYELFEKDAEAFGLVGVRPRPVSAASRRAKGGAQQKGKDAPSPTRYEDWHEAPFVVNLYGREKERAELELWLQDQSCRVIAVSGMGGVGKSALAVAAATHIKHHFDCIIWRSLRSALPAELFLKQCLEQLAQQSPSPANLPEQTNDLLMLLLPYLRNRRCLLVLDHLESVMQAGQHAASYREEYAGYGNLIQLFAEARHQSCLMLTSREQPKEVARQHSINSLVRACSLAGIDQTAAQKLLKERRLFGSKRDWTALVERYSGNPRALQHVSLSVRELFGGGIARFLREDVSAFGEISELLCQHFQRLSNEEREILYWLAIEREALPFDALRERLSWPMAAARLLEILDSLRRRSLIETRDPAHFALPMIFKEYITCCLIERAYQEFMAKMPGLWMSHALIRAESRAYTRENQPVPLLLSLAQRLLATLSKKGIEQRARHLLAMRGQGPMHHQDYLTANILSLLNHAGCTLPAQTGRGKSAALSPDRLLSIHSENDIMRELVTIES